VNDKPTFIDDDGIIVLQGYPLYRCVCGKQHIQYLGKACPCGEPFPNGVKEVIYR
jgi:hypothetical protein